MSATRPFVLSIAGLDPSGGAGLLADIKTFEQMKVQGFGVCSALTAQHESDFYSVSWLDKKAITDQLEPLFDRYLIKACKIGLIEHPALLVDIIRHVKHHFPDIKVVVDPVIKTSTGYVFHSDDKNWKVVLDEADLITPNVDEAIALGGDEDATKAAMKMAERCDTLLKGGHDPAFPGTDHLFTSSGEELLYPEGNYPSKHGSGCILSAAITASIGLGDELPEACKRGKAYTSKALASNTGLLSYHMQ